jgi:hypothetical protein
LELKEAVALYQKHTAFMEGELGALDETLTPDLVR